MGDRINLAVNSFEVGVKRAEDRDYMLRPITTSMPDGTRIFHRCRDTPLAARRVAACLRNQVLRSDFCSKSNAASKSLSNLSNRSEEHMSELQSPTNLVCRLLLE